MKLLGYYSSIVVKDWGGRVRKTVLVFCILLLSIAGCSKGSEKESIETIKQTDEKWKLRYDYKKEEKVLLQVSPDPELHAGEPFGYLFHFHAPFETFEGKKLAIYAYHKQTGEKLTALSPETIKEPSPGYSTLERFTATFSIPKSGLWRYEVKLDDQFYADVVLRVKDKTQ